MTVKLRTTEKPVGNAGYRTIVAPEALDVIPKTPVPLSPTVANEAAHLMKAGRIPCLGEDLRPSKFWI